MTPGDSIYHNDEPTNNDKLNREQYASSFALLCENCDTPLTVGIYATWGVGKTSLMKLIEKALNPEHHHVIWFNLWEHQFVENPALALSHAIAGSLNQQARKQVKKLLTLIATALGGQVLKMATGLKLLELLKLGSIYEEEHFQTLDASMRLRAHLNNLIDQVREATGKKKLVFFIDDLDRCSADQGLKLLDSLKLYFNLKDCIYFLGVDRQALQQSIKAKYNELPMEVVHYLDKIIQMPFTVPLIEPEQLREFIERLLSQELRDCQNMLELGLGGNPRQVKRFINTLLLNHHLAKNKVSDYQAPVLCALLMIQYRKPNLYQVISQKPDLLYELMQTGEEGIELRTNYLEDDLELEDVLRSIAFPPSEVLRSYVYLTDAAGIKPENSSESEPSQKAGSDEEIALFDEADFLTEEGLDQVLRETGKLEAEETIIDKMLLYRTRKQHTWLVTTQYHIFCLLDGAKTRAGHRVVQWKQKLDSQLSFRAYKSVKGSPVVDIGSRKRWLYSRRLYSEPQQLENRIEQLIHRALSH